MMLRTESACLAWHHSSATPIHQLTFIPSPILLHANLAPASGPLHTLFPLPEYPSLRPLPSTFSSGHLFGRHLLGSPPEMPSPTPPLGAHFVLSRALRIILVFFQHMSFPKRIWVQSGRVTTCPGHHGIPQCTDGAWPAQVLAQCSPTRGLSDLQPDSAAQPHWVSRSTGTTQSSRCFHMPHPWQIS